jgi:hypothetical protein
MSEPEPDNNPSTQGRGMETGGRGDKGRGRGGRGRGRGARNGTRSNNKNAANSNHAPTAIFKGNTDGMNGNVFHCHGENTDKQ